MIDFEFPSQKIKRLWPEDYTQAKKLYQIETDKMYATGYAGDFGSGFDFALDTYGPICWIQFFVGPNREKIAKEFPIDFLPRGILDI